MLFNGRQRSYALLIFAIATIHLLSFADARVYDFVLEDPKCEREMDLDCPLLTCEDNKLEPGVCYEHDGEATSSTIKGNLCYDVETARQTDTVYVCPFNIRDYMWLDERLQGQGRDSAAMCCK